jgi:hypothetical protein
MELETLYGKYQSVDEVDKQVVAKKFITKIHKIRKQHHEFATTAERPIAIGGNIRGMVKDNLEAFPDLDPIASEVSTPKLYYKIFTIEHK